MTQELSQWSLVMLMSASLAVGFAFGALYDLFRIRRRAFELSHRRKKLLTRFVQGFIIVIEDLFFFLLLGCVSAVMYYVFTNGQVRLPAIAFEAIGFLLYRLSIGRLVMSVTDAIIAFFRLVLSIVKRRIVDPVVRLARRITGALCNRIERGVRRRRRARYSAYRRKQLLKASEHGLL